MSEERVVYSIQKTYIITSRMNARKTILTCDQRIDIPTIEPLAEMKPIIYQDKFSKIIPCIELAGILSDESESQVNLEFETNEGVTVLPIKIGSGRTNPIENPYMHPRYVLVLPRDATGVKSCKVVYRYSGEVVQHNLTFGIMSPPYNYDNALFGYFSSQVGGVIETMPIFYEELTNLTARVTALENKAGG